MSYIYSTPSTSGINFPRTYHGYQHVLKLAKLLGGVHGRLLSNEIVAVKHPDLVHCSSGAIQKLIKDEL